MNNIREEIQTWLELVTRAVKNIPFDKEIHWFDIEEVYIGDYYTPMFSAYNEQLSYESVYSDAVSIDHMSSEILKGDFTQAMILLKRYKGIIITNNFYKEY
tara:strand:- start:96 stop:398 length:303 start_codon:yes stop_codon:yes gene_type:complete